MEYYDNPLRSWCVFCRGGDFQCLQAACHRKGWRAWEAVLNENILPPGTNSPVCLHGQVNSHQQKKDEICFKKMCVDLSKAECCDTKVFRTSLATCPCKRNYPSWIDSMDYPIIRIIFTSPKKTSSLISTFSPNAYHETRWNRNKSSIGASASPWKGKRDSGEVEQNSDGVIGVFKIQHGKK